MKPKLTVAVAAFFLIAFALLPTNIYAQSGSLDLTFDNDGIVTTAISTDNYEGYSVALQNDGKIVVVGTRQVGANTDFAIIRYNSNGGLDTTFSSDGIATTDIGGSADLSFSIAIQNDGKIVLAGCSYNGNNQDFAVVRYNTNGSLDTSFNADGIVTTDIGGDHDVGTYMVIQNDGKIVVAGSSEIGFQSYFAIIRYNTNGSLDTTFDADGIPILINTFPKTISARLQFLFTIPVFISVRAILYSRRSHASPQLTSPNSQNNASKKNYINIW